VLTFTPCKEPYGRRKLFTGNDWLYNQDIVIEDGIIQAVTASTGNGFVTNDVETFMAPAFVDFQVYGAAQKLFAVYPTAGTLQAMYDVFAKDGTCLFQPTLATNTPEVFRQGIDAVREYWQLGGKGRCRPAPGGSLDSPAKRGAHIESMIHQGGGGGGGMGKGGGGGTQQ
jgi:N-acetylglucosamine-6-phosphate deacetylase